ncbi:hypothetical protein [Desulfomonile tiedjei]|uniref:Uncharacterized protein n=1 Tax=Desulfomonile tiedjei (strain ATCC 49306 / DSM 6799 / DCB-1) TaxID=706587 RepID=I4CC48_DESTA|nr:hypothetical protein [Desulfomonile tiedjei]AFM27139.1 hypothetical protein Desti_4508 [Desulfomonile tiedjei DSM 6799]
MTDSGTDEKEAYLPTDSKFPERSGFGLTRRVAAPIIVSIPIA